jgi:hypothetical protein
MKSNWISIEPGNMVPPVHFYKVEDTNGNTEDIFIGSPVFLVTDGDYVEEAMILDGKIHTDGERVCAEDVTHWMPMPKPPPKEKNRKILK